MKKYLSKRTIHIAIGVASLCLITAVAFGWSQSAKAAKEEQREEEINACQEQIKEIYTTEYQDKVAARLENAKNTGSYNEDVMLIEANPFGTNTLSLYVYFKTEKAADISYTVSVADDEIDDFTVDDDGTFETEHEMQVIGLVPDQKNTVTFTITYEDGTTKESEYTTNIGSVIGEEETKLSVSQIEDSGEELSDGLYVILGNDSDDLDFMYYYDNQGVLRGEIPLIGYRSHRLLFQNNLMYYSISETKIAAVNHIGQVEQIYNTGKYELHHDYAFDDDGNLVILATDTESDTEEDMIVRLDVETGEIISAVDLSDIFGTYKESCIEPEEGAMDWIHINTLQWLGDETVILSSRETSTIIKLSNIFSEPVIDYLIGEENLWEGTDFESYVLEKDGEFSNTGGQHTVTYMEDASLEEGQYYLYMFNNNFGVSETNPYDWIQIDGIETSVKEGKTSYYYKYLVNENEGTYSLVQSIEVPFSAYVSSAQHYDSNIIIDSGMAGIFGEYDSDGNLIKQFEMNLSKYYIYRVYKYEISTLAGI